VLIDDRLDCVKLDIKAELLRELALEVGTPTPDIGVRAGRDHLHPLYRGKPVVSFASWDLLGVYGHPEVSTTLVKSVKTYGVASLGSRFSGGTTDAHVHSEGRIAKFFVAESTLFFASRNQCVLTVITTLCSEGVIVIGSALSSLPLADACALVGAEFVEVDGDEQLRAALQRTSFSKRVIVVLEGLSPLTGESLQLPHILPAIEQAGAWLVLDESAALGLSGIRGAGTAEQTPTSPALIGRIVGFNYAAGVDLCALVSGQELRDLINLRSKYVRYEGAPAPSLVRAAESALNILEVALVQREKLGIRALSLSRAIKSQGWRMLTRLDSPVLSLWCESLLSARTIQEALLQRGILVEALPARSTRRNGAVVRVLVSNGHTQEEVELLLSSLDEVKKRLEKASSAR
jgi:7-keto-8-aminopelargonate synthetase-like enzyme